MHDRPAVFVRVEDVAGHVGWGEIWCNFPACGAEHRARLLDTVVAPLVVRKVFANPWSAFAHMQERTAVLAIQSGEPGPLSQVVAGLDLAMWDLLSRRANMPLWQFLGGVSGQVPVYASGLNPDQPERIAEQKYAEGFRAFKLKVGFGKDKDVANLTAMRQVVPQDVRWMVDANQAWDLPTAKIMAQALQPFSLLWLEEPLRADRPLSEWLELAKFCAGVGAGAGASKGKAGIGLAAGENLIGAAAFEQMVKSQALRVVQPDIAKWGGISGCLPVIAQILYAGLRYCPHYLGAGPGLMASAHLMAAVGGPDAMLEVDANENPLRTEFAPCFQTVRDGVAQLGHATGIGVEPRMQDIEKYQLKS